MTSKSFFNNEISEAILAAAKSTGRDFSSIDQKQREEDGGEEGEEEKGSFLHRLHKNSQLLLYDVDPNNGKQEAIDDAQQQLFSPSRNLVEEKKRDGTIQNNGGTIGENQIVVEIPANIIAKLNELFGEEKEEGDGKEEANSIEVSLPLWVCELLYKASQKMPIADIADEEGEVLKSDKGRKGTIKYKNMSSNLRLLYDAFPNIPPKTIKQCAKENNYDYNQTADHLLTIVEFSEMEIPEEIEPGGVDYGSRPSLFIMPSHCPRVISVEQQQRREASPPTNLVVPDQWYRERVEEIEQMSKYVELIEMQRKYCIEMSKMNSGTRDGAIRYHYASRAQSLINDKNLFEKQLDRIRAWNTHNDAIIDLHNMGCERALDLVKFKIDLCREKHPNFRKLHAITGYGRTTGQPSIIRSRLIQFLKQKGIEHSISATNHGVVEIRLGGIHQRLT